MIDMDSASPFNNSLKTLERMHVLMVDSREARINLSWHTYKLCLFELFKEVSPFLCESLKHFDKDSNGCDDGDKCPLGKLKKLWVDIEGFDLELDSYKRVRVIDTDVIPLLDHFDFMLKSLMKSKGLSYVKGADVGSAILGRS